MLFWTVVTFITYSLVYFIISQKKIKRLQNANLKLNMSLSEKGHVMHNSMNVKGQLKKEMSN